MKSSIVSRVLQTTSTSLRSHSWSCHSLSYSFCGSLSWNVCIEKSSNECLRTLVSTSSYCEGTGFESRPEDDLSSSWRWDTLTKWNRVLTEKLRDARLIKEFPALFWTINFNTAFTRARNNTLKYNNTVTILILTNSSFTNIPSVDVM
jgi:hypothetical protein